MHIFMKNQHKDHRTLIGQPAAIAVSNCEIFAPVFFSFPPLFEV